MSGLFVQPMGGVELLKKSEDYEHAVYAFGDKVLRTESFARMSRLGNHYDGSDESIGSWMQMMAHACEQELDTLASYGILAPNPKFRVDIPDDQRLTKIFVVTDRVHGEVLSNDGVPDTEQGREYATRVSRYCQDVIDRDTKDAVIPIEALLGHNVMTGHTTADKRDGFYVVDLDPYLRFGDNAKDAARSFQHIMGRVLE